MVKQERCKDCGTGQIIRVKYMRDIETVLCSTCLQSRAQLQQIKEDKLPFPKLLAKIQAEVAKRVHAEIASMSGLERLSGYNYKGVSSWNTVHTNISHYWVEQLSYMGEDNGKE